jgi:hypothetical protein
MISTIPIHDIIRRIVPSRRPSGAEGVRQALREMRDPLSVETYGILGEPDLEEHGGYFSSVLKVVIPVESATFGDAGSLVFDLPNDESDGEADLLALLDAFDLTADEVDQLQGRLVPLEYSGGNVVVQWDQMD